MSKDHTNILDDWILSNPGMVNGFVTIKSH
jgi:hypothetical protein